MDAELESLSRDNVPSVPSDTIVCVIGAALRMGMPLISARLMRLMGLIGLGN